MEDTGINSKLQSELSEISNSDRTASHQSTTSTSTIISTILSGPDTVWYSYSAFDQGNPSDWATRGLSTLSAPMMPISWPSDAKKFQLQQFQHPQNQQPQHMQCVSYPLFSGQAGQLRSMSDGTPSGSGGNANGMNFVYTQPLYSEQNAEELELVYPQGTDLRSMDNGPNTHSHEPFAPLHSYPRVWCHKQWLCPPLWFMSFCHWFTFRVFCEVFFMSGWSILPGTIIPSFCHDTRPIGTQAKRALVRHVYIHLTSRSLMALCADQSPLCVATFLSADDQSPTHVVYLSRPFHCEVEEITTYCRSLIQWLHVSSFHSSLTYHSMDFDHPSMSCQLPYFFFPLHDPTVFCILSTIIPCFTNFINMIMSPFLVGSRLEFFSLDVFYIGFHIGIYN